MPDTNRSFELIFHPTDFTESSDIAFNHALAVALSNKSYLDILHVGKSGDGDWSEFPEVRRTLERWSLLKTGSSKEAVLKKLGIKVRKVELGGNKPLAAMTRFLDDAPADLIVLATEGRDGLPQWLKPSVSERLARRSRIPTLFVPVGARGFVSPDRGEIQLERVLVPVNHQPNPQAAIDGACGFLHCVKAEKSTIQALFVGEASRTPEVTPPVGLNCSFERIVRSGEPVEEIIAATNECEADMIVMVTAGHQGFLDAFRGSTTEQVLRRAPCPVLAIPAMEQ